MTRLTALDELEMIGSRHALESVADSVGAMEPTSETVVVEIQSEAPRGACALHLASFSVPDRCLQDAASEMTVSKFWIRE